MHEPRTKIMLWTLCAGAFFLTILHANGAPLAQAISVATVAGPQDAQSPDHGEAATPSGLKQTPLPLPHPPESSVLVNPAADPAAEARYSYSPQFGTTHNQADVASGPMPIFVRPGSSGISSERPDSTSPIFDPQQNIGRRGMSFGVNVGF